MQISKDILNKNVINVILITNIRNEVLLVIIKKLQNRISSSKTAMTCSFETSRRK